MTKSKLNSTCISHQLLDAYKSNKTNKIKELFTFERSTIISPKLIGLTINVHNGNSFNKLLIKENMLGKKLGEFSPTRKRFSFKKKK